MKYLCIDYGAKRVGISVSDAAGTIAFPRKTLPNDAQLKARIEEIIMQEGVASIVVGDTLSHGGARNSVSAAAQSFSDELAEQSGLPIKRAWEVWSSIEAGRLAPKGKEHDDAAAAAFILQRFLDMHQSG